AGPNAFGLPFVPYSLAVGPDGSVYASDVFTTGIYKYESDGTPVTGPVTDPYFASVYPPGTPVPNPFIVADIPDRPSFAPFPNAPSGLAFDPLGDLYIGLLGPTNPLSNLDRDRNESHGALLRYNADGSLDTLAFGLPPVGGIALLEDTAVPEPATEA